MKKKMNLFLQKIVDDLLTVPSVGTIADMHPVGAFRVMLPDQLVEIAMALDPIKPPFAFGHVPVDAEVCRLAAHVLTVAHASHGLIECQRAEAAANLDGLSHRLAEWLQHLMNEGAQIHHIGLTGIVADALGLGRVAGTKLLEREILTYIRCHSIIFFRTQRRRDSEFFCSGSKLFTIHFSLLP